MIHHVLVINQSFTIYHVMMIYHSPFYPPIKSDNGEYSFTVLFTIIITMFIQLLTIIHHQSLLIVMFECSIIVTIHPPFTIIVTNIDPS